MKISSPPGGLTRKSLHATGEFTPLPGMVMHVCRLNLSDTSKARKGRIQDHFEVNPLLHNKRREL